MAQAPENLRIEREEAAGQGAFFVTKDGARLGEMAFTRLGEKRVLVEHTEVDDSLRGMGVARKLLDALVAWARATHTQVSATCPYARAQLEKDASLQDVYLPA